MTPAKKTTAKKTSPKKSTAKKSTAKKSTARFSAEERAALKERAQELKAEQARGKGAEKAAAEAKAVLDKIAEMPPKDRALAKKLHALITDAAPDLAPKLWYGMPTYTRDGKNVCFFQPASKFKSRYSTLGFDEHANLDNREFHLLITKSSTDAVLVLRVIKSQERQRVRAHEPPDSSSPNCTLVIFHGRSAWLTVALGRGMHHIGLQLRHWSMP